MTMHEPPFSGKKGVVHLFHGWDALAIADWSRNLKNLCEMPLLEVTREVARLWSMPCHRLSRGIFWCFLCLHLHIGTLASKLWNFQIYSGRSAHDACTTKSPFSAQVEEEWMHSHTLFRY
jgi:hypothetical protein